MKPAIDEGNPSGTRPVTCWNRCKVFISKNAAAIVLAFATIVLASATVLLWLDTRRYANLAKQTLDLQREEILIKRVREEKKELVDWTLKCIKDKEGKYPYGEIKIINIINNSEMELRNATWEFCVLSKKEEEKDFSVNTSPVRLKARLRPIKEVKISKEDLLRLNQYLQDHPESNFEDFRINLSFTFPSGYTKIIEKNFNPE